MILLLIIILIYGFIKAAEKIRTFLLEKIRMLAAPKTNVTIIQQSVLLKVGPRERYLPSHMFMSYIHSTKPCTTLSFPATAKWRKKLDSNMTIPWVDTT